MGEPSDIEKKLSNKGEDLTVSQAITRIDFIYLCICSLIVIGTSRLFDENAESLGLHDDEREDMIQDTYGVFEVIGAVTAGGILTLFRSKVRPSLMMVFLIVIGGLGQLAMIWPDSFTIADPMRVAVAAASFAEGGAMATLASFCHEEYGTENFGIFYGTMLSFGFAGLYAVDEIFFPSIFEWYATENAAGVHYFKSYGEWNEFLFTCLAVSYGVCAILAIISHVSVVNREIKDSSKLAMVSF